LGFDVVGIGQCCVDYLGVVDSYPPVNEKKELSAFKIEGGGPTATALVTLSRLNVPTSFIGKIGGGYFAALIKEGLKVEGVDIKGMVEEAGKTSQFAFICVEKETGHRNIFFTRGSVTPLKFDEINKSCIDGCKILHLDGLMIDVSIEAAKYAKSIGKKVSLDAGTLRGSPKKSPMVELCRYTDYLVTSEKFAKSYIKQSSDYENALKKLKKLGPEIVCITLGEKGSIAIKDDYIIRQPAYDVKAVDTTGAGDVYHGGFIYGILKGYDIRKTMAFASFVSALKCRELGGRSGIPKAGEHDFI
jgi:ribokinase